VSTTRRFSGNRWWGLLADVGKTKQNEQQLEFEPPVQVDEQV